MRGQRLIGSVVVGLLAFAPIVSQQASAVSARPTTAPAGKSLDDGAVRAIVAKQLASQASQLGLTRADVTDFEITDIVRSDNNGLISVYVKQAVDGIGIFNAITTVTLNADGSPFYLANRFLPDAISRVARSTAPSLAPVQALDKAAAALGVSVTNPPVVVQAPSGDDNELVINAGASVSTAPVTGRLEYVGDKDLHLAWSFAIDTPGVDSWIVHVDASTGKELNRASLVDQDTFSTPAADTASAPTAVAAPSALAAGGNSVGFVFPPAPVADGSSYLVFAPPIEAPSFGSRTPITNPADAAASPFGWHDTNGVAGAESTFTTGNNVDAYTDTDHNDVPDASSRPNGGAGLTFTPALDLTLDPSTYRPAAVTNLFFANNYIHDVLYHYGFNAAAGNFQVNNYGHGGAGGDAVQAEAQDGSGLNNANFGTPADGTAPRMQMYVFNQTAPNRDGDFDNGVIFHEYTHGVSNRLTGGPAIVTCLGNDEQLGEGWSDFVSLMLTDPGISPLGTRGAGTYVLGQPTTGPGIRNHPYSTDIAVNPSTYDTIKNVLFLPGDLPEPHAVGEVWAEMLYEMTAALVTRYGNSTNLYTGTAGNNRALQLVLDGMKLQPCSPGFVDGRDAIIAADAADYAGADTCLLWTAFAKRGLGFSATQGSSEDVRDGVQAFDVPPSCIPLSLTPSAATAAAGTPVSYTLTVRNLTASASTGNVVTVPVPAGTAYVAGSANCAVSSTASTLTFTQATMAAGAVSTCTFSMRMPFTGSLTVFSDNFDAGAGKWSTPADTNPGGQTWALSTASPRSAPNEMFATDPALVSDQRLVTAAPVSIPAGSPVLEFWHSRNFETDVNGDYDGGVVEYCVASGGNCGDAGAGWVDAGSKMTENGYNGTIFAGTNPIAGRAAFTRQSSYIRTTVNLASLAGQSVYFRFRDTSDNSVSATGWLIDDVAIGRIVRVALTATRTNNDPSTTSATATVQLNDGDATAAGAPTALTGAPGDGQVALSSTAPVSNGGLPITDYRIQLSTNGGPFAVVADGVSALPTATITGLSNGASYRFIVEAITGFGPGADSNTATVALPLLAPRAPTGLAAVPTTGQITLSWTAPASNGGSPITDYVVELSSDGGATWSVFADGVSSATSATVSGLANATSYQFRVSATNAVGTGAPSAAVGAATQPPIFTSLTPLRVFDTRPDSPQGAVAVDQHKYGGGVELKVKVTGVGGVPLSGVGAVSLNVTAVDPDGSGFVTVYPCGDRPLGSNLNYVRGDVVPNAVIAPVSAAGEVCFYSLVDTHLIADINGWFAAGAGLTPLSPLRVFDTRPDSPQGAVTIDQHKYGGGVELKVKVTGVGGVPLSGVGAVSLNVTAVDPDGSGFVTVYPCGDRPLGSNLNYVRGDVVPNAVIAPVSATGEVCFYSLVDTHLIADINGWFAAGAGFTSLTPLRVFDTRPDQPQGAIAVDQHKYGGGVELKVKVTGVGGVPLTGVGAVSLNVTAVDPDGSGFVTVYPCGERPLGSNLNYVRGDVVPNAVIAPVSASGEVCFYSLVDTHLIADINGWFAN